MSKFKAFIDLLFTYKFLTKFIAYFLIIVFFYLFSDFLIIFFLTFIFAYLFLSLGKFIKTKFDLFVLRLCRSDARVKFLRKIISVNLIIVIEYIIFIGFIVFTISNVIPKLIGELSTLPDTIPFIADQVQVVTSKLQEIKTFNTELGGTIDQVLTSKDIDVILNILSSIKSASVVFLQIFLSLILSFVFLIDRIKLYAYLKQIKKSNFNFLYKEYKNIFEKIVMSFGLIFKAQATIALVNALLTTVGLFIIGLIHGGAFPYLLTLALIVFIAGFIPVLGVFISSIPILAIAFSMIGGYPVVIEIILLIGIVHMVEAYYLNPKIVSSFLDIPMSLTFIILIVSEHLFGIAGLLIGISLFYFMVGLFRDLDKVIGKKKKEIKKVKI